MRATRCAAMQRHASRGSQVRRGLLDPRSPIVAARLRDEGVPEAEIPAVAAQLKRILPLATATGSDRAYILLHPWVAELVARYDDKLDALFFTTRGKVEAR